MPRKFRTNQHLLPKTEGHFVYCYLSKDNKPYYIGQGARRDRMTGKHSVPVPSDRSRIRIMRNGLTQEEADHWEIFYIDRYGMVRDGTGILWNTETGGKTGKELVQEVKDQISAKVKQLHAEGAFAKLNSAKVIKIRAKQREINQAEANGVPVDVYRSMTKGERDAMKKWFKANEGKTYDQYLSSKRSAKSAAQYGVPLDVWNGLTRGKKNALKEYCRRDSRRNGMDYLNGHRATPGSKRTIDREQVFALKAEGLSQSKIAAQVGCHQSVVNRILLGKRHSAQRRELLPA